MAYRDPAWWNLRRPHWRMSAWVFGLLVLFWASWVHAGEREEALWLQRLSFGVTPQSLADVQRTGREAWLAQQWRRDMPLASAPAVQARIEALKVSQLTGLQALAQVQAQRALLRERADPASAAMQRKQLRSELDALQGQAIQRTLLRAVYSPQPLREVLTWFWFNHFNVVAEGDFVLQAMVGDYEQNVIRHHATGRFRDLLQAVATHPAMLVYLNNDRNVRGHINENYARELMELHTLGVDGGYTQQDVQQLARILTGLSVGRPGDSRLPDGAVSLSGGLALFLPRRHEPGPKTLLGRTLDQDGWAQIEQALDMLARHPATARYISLKLARYFVADEPSPDLVQRLSRRFLDTEGDIAAVMQTLVNSPEFAASLGRKFKDPVHYVVSAVRLMLPNDPVELRVARLQGWLRQLDEPLYGRRTPDGYPLVASAWNGSGQMTQRFEVAQQIAKAQHLDLPEAGGIRLLGPQDEFSQRVWLPGLSSRSREVLQEAQAHPVVWRRLLLSTPEFMFR